MVLLFAAAGVLFRISDRGRPEIPSIKDGSSSEQGCSKGTSTDKDRVILKEYHVDPRRSSSLDILPPDREGVSAEKKLASSINDTSGMDSTSFDSSHIPPRIKNMAEQLIDLKNELDDSTLQSVNSTLGHIPIVEVKADSAVLRPSGDGIRLTVNIPAENIRMKEDEKE